MRKTIASFLLVTFVFTLIACSGSALETAEISLADQPAAEADIAEQSQQSSETVSSSSLVVEYDSEELNPGYNSPDTSYIRLDGDSISLEGSGAIVSGNFVTIASAGTFNISGALNDGQVIVDTQDEGTVTLILSGANITSSSSAPIYIRNAEKTIITLADGAENQVTDGTSYLFDGVEIDEPNAAIFSKDDLTINGSGSLLVTANYNNGIASKDDLKITGGAITVNAVNDGIKGRDCIAVRDGTITVNAGGDGLQSNNDENVAKGYVLIEGGVLDITASLDGIQAQTRLVINGGRINIDSGGGSANSSLDGGGVWGNHSMEGNPSKPTESAKGLKAGVDITIAGSVLQIESADDAIHSNSSVVIDGGDISITSGDDGIHADSTLTINNGHIDIAKSYEGIESTTVTLNGGNIYILASDDGVNVAGGNDDSSINGRPGQNNFELSGNAHFYVNSGYLFVDSIGDGIDVNGMIDMTGGTVIVNGPTNDGNGPLDYLGSFNITGGYLLAVGSSGMAQAPSASSAQYSVMYNFNSTQAAGALVHIETADGQGILTFKPAKSYQSLLLSSPDLANGSTYVVYSGGSSSGAVLDGLYSGGVYSEGTQIASFTISSVVTTAGAAGGFGPGGFGPGGDGPGGAPHP